MNCIVTVGLYLYMIFYSLGSESHQNVSELDTRDSTHNVSMLESRAFAASVVLNESTLKNKTHTKLYKPDDKLMGNKIFRQTFFMMVLEKKYMRKEKFEMTTNKKGNYLLSNYPFTT